MKRKKDDFWDTGETLRIEFESEEAAGHFKSWLCESGEQQYWEWMAERELELDDGDDPITVIEFDYFQPNGLIKTELGKINR